MFKDVNGPSSIKEKQSNHALCKKILSNGSKPKKYPYEQVAFTTVTTTAKTNLQRAGNIIEKGAFKKYS